MSTAREQQNIEWKESWREEYFKWICGFANAQGGRIYLGKNDDGHVVGLTNIRKLLEDLPNQVRDLMGILVEVNRQEDSGLEYWEIVVEPYPYPISYRGQYHYRSGSTKQELKSPALSAFLLQKQGKRWDEVPVPGVTTTDLSAEAFDLPRCVGEGRPPAENWYPWGRHGVPVNWLMIGSLRDGTPLQLVEQALCRHFF